MAEDGKKIEDILNKAHQDYGTKNGLTPEHEVFQTFVYKDPKAKKAAAKYFKKAVNEWTNNPSLADEIEEHELGHALADKGPGRFKLQAKIVSSDGPIATAGVRPSYQTVGSRSPKELIKIIKSGGHHLSDTDKQQIELLEQEIRNSKKWWQFWKK